MHILYMYSTFHFALLRFITIHYLIKHLKEEHKMDFHVKEITFETYDEFIKWKGLEEDKLDKLCPKQWSKNL